MSALQFLHQAKYLKKSSPLRFTDAEDGNEHVCKSRSEVCFSSIFNECSASSQERMV